MTTMEKVIMVLLIMAIALFVILLATDNVQVIIVVNEKIKTGAERINWKEVLKVAKNII